MDDIALRLTDTTGRTLALDRFETDGLLCLLDAHPPLLEALASGVVPAALTHEMGRVLASCEVRVLLWEGGQRIVTGSDLGTDPVVAWCARLADLVGAQDLAGAARGTLVAQAGGAVVDDDDVRARVRTWASYLLSSTGALEVERQPAR